MKSLLICGLLVAIAAIFVVRSIGGNRAAAAGNPITIPALDIGPGPFTKKDFWALIDRSAAFEADPDRQLREFRASLDRLTPDQIATFEQMFNETMRQSYTWDLWGAAYLANGGASDDGFEYFRCWLVSKGKRAFETVSADPDQLAVLLAPGSGGDLEFEEFAYVAREAWAAKTGRDWNEMPIVANMIYEDGPSGKPFSEDDRDLSARYPKLWARFGRG